LRDPDGGEIADIGESFEAVIRSNEFAGSPSAAGRQTVSSASPQMNKIGTLVGPIGCRSPRPIPGKGGFHRRWLPITIRTSIAGDARP